MNEAEVREASAAWAADFSYAYFVNLLQTIQSNFDLCLFSRAGQCLSIAPSRPVLFLRHDVDVNLDRALQMATIESDLGIRAVYMVMVNSPLYRIEDSSSQTALLRLVSMGHEVGLHFDFDDEESRNQADLWSAEPKIQSDCARLESVIQSQVQSVSFHRPLAQFLRGPFLVGGRTNAYSRELMSWYLSDSKGSWREGEPIPKLRDPKGSILQLLIHPIWWGEKHMRREDRLKEFYESIARDMSPVETNAFDAALFDQVKVQRSGTG